MRCALPFALLLTACADVAPLGRVPFAALSGAPQVRVSTAADDQDITRRRAELVARADLLRRLDQRALQ